MLTVYNGTIDVDQQFVAFLNQAPPESAQELLNVEKQHEEFGRKIQDFLTGNLLRRCHENKDWVGRIVTETRFRDGRPLKNQGWRWVTIQLSGGSTVTFKTPYLSVRRPPASKK